jgi:CDP-glucose 4,6-dehydratase
MYNQVYSGKKVIITGHTGFKGSWLTTWLLKLGAQVVGISSNIPTQPSMFQELNLKDKITDYCVDVRDFEKLKQVIVSEKPDFVFHLAAQALVVPSYKNPIDTFSSNVMGTANVLEALRLYNNNCVVVMITSDKCYDNVEWEWGYKESDVLGGKDIYSGSKGGAELVIKSYYHSFFKNEGSNIRLVSARAGNVIGGGDWAEFRIVPDCMRAWKDGESVEIRSPEATRPWQHVLEPLSGYLAVGQKLFENPELSGSSFNFGPHAEYSKTVFELLNDLSKNWNLKQEPSFFPEKTNKFHEAGLLKLNCDKALFYLKWMPTLDFDKLIRFTSDWYYAFYNNKSADLMKITLDQIQEYEATAKQKGIKWTKK